MAFPFVLPQVAGAAQPVPPPVPTPPAPPAPPAAPVAPGGAALATGPRNIAWDAFYLDERNTAIARAVHPVSSFFSRFTAFQGPPGYATAVATTAARNLANPLADPTVAKVLPETFAALGTTSKTTEDHFREKRTYVVFAPDRLLAAFRANPADFSPTDGKARRTVRVGLFFGVGPEVNLFGLRSFFAGTDDCVLVTVPGVEAAWKGYGRAWGIGITTAMIADLLTAAGLGGAAFAVETMAGYSTGYRGVNLTVINRLVDLSGLQRLVYYDAFYHHDDHPVAPAPHPFAGKNTLWAGTLALSARPTSEVVVYAYTEAGVPRGAGDAPRGPLKELKKLGSSRIRFVDLTVARDGRPAIDYQLESVCVARLVQAAIGDYVERGSVAPKILALVDALPARGAFGTLGRSGSTDLYAWAKTTPNAQLLAAFPVEEALKMVTGRSLLGGWTTSRFELRHRDFVQEIGRESLLPG